MSDKTFGVKVSEELYDRVKNMIDVSGGNAKVWFEKAVSLAAVQDLKDGSGDYKQDLSELEVHTTRIYELVGNMIQRANFLKDDAVRELDEKLASRELTISELQINAKALKEQLSKAEEGFKNNETEKAELQDQLEEIRAANSNNQDLIKEYKEKVDTLSSLVNEYKGYAAENLELKQVFTAEKEQMKAEFGEKESRMVSSIEELKTTARDQATTIEHLKEKLNNAIEDHKEELDKQMVNHSNQLTQLTDRKELEKERAILEIERKYQAKLEKLQDQYNEKITSLYEKLDRNDVEDSKDDTK
jgi:chromosome segregation ATPase